MNDNKSRDIFYGVVAVATLIVALIGATLAYFSITANSSEGAVSAQAAVVSVAYNDTNQVSADGDELIPASFTVVKDVYEDLEEGGALDGTGTTSNLCIDDNDRQVCSIYRFSVSSDIDVNGVDIIATLRTESNTFTDLKYAVRDVTNSSWIVLDTSEGNRQYLGLETCDNDDTDLSNCYTGTSGNKTYSETNPIAVRPIFGYNGSTKNSVNVGSTPKTYDVVLFIENKDANQNYDQGKVYSGTLYVETTTGSGQISGEYTPQP